MRTWNITYLFDSAIYNCKRNFDGFNVFPFVIQPKMSRIRNTDVDVFLTLAFLLLLASLLYLSYLLAKVINVAGDTVVYLKNVNNFAPI